MGSIARGVLRQMAGGGDRPKDRWTPATTGDSTVRLYRWETPDGKGGVEKQYVFTRKLHFRGKGQAPTECPETASCEDCRRAAMLEAAGDEASREKARGLRAVTNPTFVVCPIDEPDRLRTFDARFTAFQGILLETAKAGGWRSAKYPGDEAWAEGNEQGPLFEKCVEEGLNKVCGPNGQDLVLTPTKKGQGFTWSVSRMPDGNKVLPFPEDHTVPNPEAIQARIRAAVAAKAEKGGE